MKQATNRHSGKGFTKRELITGIVRRIAGFGKAPSSVRLRAPLTGGIGRRGFVFGLVGAAAVATISGTVGCASSGGVGKSREPVRVEAPRPHKSATEFVKGVSKVEDIPGMLEAKGVEKGKWAIAVHEESKNTVLLAASKGMNALYWFQDGVYRGKLFDLNVLGLVGVKFSEAVNWSMLVSNSGRIFIAAENLSATAEDGTRSQVVVSIYPEESEGLSVNGKFEKLEKYPTLEGLFGFDQGLFMQSAMKAWPELYGELCKKDNSCERREREPKKQAEQQPKTQAKFVDLRKIVEKVLLSESFVRPQLIEYEGKVLLHARREDGVPWDYAYVFDVNSGRLVGGKKGAEYLEKAGF